MKPHKSHHIVISIYHTMHFYFQFPLLPGVENMKSALFQLVYMILQQFSSDYTYIPCLTNGNAICHFSIPYLACGVEEKIVRMSQSRGMWFSIFSTWKTRNGIENLGILHCTCSNSYAIIFREIHNSFPFNNFTCFIDKQRRSLGV
jgi:hypothetical protein